MRSTSGPNAATAARAVSTGLDVLDDVVEQRRDRLVLVRAELHRDRARAEQVADVGHVRLLAGFPGMERRGDAECLEEPLRA